MLSTDKQTNKQTKQRYQKITSFAKEVTRSTQRAQSSLAEVDHYHLMNPYFAKEVMNVEPLWWKANPKSSGSLPAPRSDHATAIMMFFDNLVILEDFNQQQNVISSSLYHPGAVHKISSKSFPKFLSNVVHKQMDRQAYKPTLPKT